MRPMIHTSDEALIKKYQLWLKETDEEKKKLLARLKELYAEEKELYQWICELKGEEFVE